MTYIGDYRAPASERDALNAWLDHERSTIIRKIEGVSESDARTPMVPSGTSLLGIVKHLAYVERWWFQGYMANEAEPLFRGDASGGDWKVADDETTASLTALYEAMCQRSREIASSSELDELSRYPNTGYSLRWIMLHLIEETARHAGHADIIREQLDGVTGL